MTFTNTVVYVLLIVAFLSQLRISPAQDVLNVDLLIWPWHDVDPEDLYFEAASMLTIAGIWKQDPWSVYFRPEHNLTRQELAESLRRLCGTSLDPLS